MTWLNGANLVLAPVVPLLLGAPKYLTGELSLGSLMQAATAFAQVQVALNWLADNAIRLADWFASSRRVSQLTDAIGRLEQSLGPIGQSEGIEIGASPDGNIHLRGLDIEQYDGTLMIDDAEAIVKPGEKVLVKGDSGTGKSTLIRAMAGLWPWGSGKILKPEDAEFAFMPQRPYFPLGTLRQALLYPFADQKVEEEKIDDALTRCGLDHLIPRLDEVESWSQVLSGGEQQRLAFARVMIRPPDILIMDEPTSSLDELSQFRMMEYMRDFLPKTTVIHVGHRPGLEPFHDREIKLVRKVRGGPATTEGGTEKKQSPKSRRAIFSRALQRFRRRPSDDNRENAGLSRAHAGEEFLDFRFEAVALARERLCRGQKISGGRAGLVRAAIDFADMGDDLRGAGRGLLHIAGDVFGDRILLLDRARDRSRDFRNAADGAADFLDRGDGFAGRHLHARDLRPDFFSGFGSLRGELLHLGRHDCETAARLRRARGLDGRIESKKIGLLGDGGDQRHHVTDTGRGL